MRCGLVELYRRGNKADEISQRVALLNLALLFHHDEGDEASGKKD